MLTSRRLICELKMQHFSHSKPTLPFPVVTQAFTKRQALRLKDTHSSLIFTSSHEQLLDWLRLPGAAQAPRTPRVVRKDLTQVRLVQFIVLAAITTTYHNYYRYSCSYCDSTTNATIKTRCYSTSLMLQIKIQAPATHQTICISALLITHTCNVPLTHHSVGFDDRMLRVVCLRACVYMCARVIEVHTSKHSRSDGRSSQTISFTTLPKMQCKGG